MSVTRNPDASGDTRQRIIDIALELFATRGYAGTSIRDIAGGLGVLHFVYTNVLVLTGSAILLITMLGTSRLYWRQSITLLVAISPGNGW